MRDQGAKRPTTPIPSFLLSDKKQSIESVTKGPRRSISSDAVGKLQKGVDTLKKRLGDIHEDVAIAIDAVASAHADNEDFDRALRHYNDALEMKKKTLPQHHPSIANTLTSVGDVSQKIGLITESEAAYRAAHAIYRNAFDERSWVTGTNSDNEKQKTDFDLHQKMSTTMVQIGTIEYRRENYDEALNCFQAAKKEAKLSAIDAVVLDRSRTKKKTTSLVTETRIFISVIMNNIANVYAQLHDKQRAILTYNSALNLQMQEVGEDHLCVSSTLHNMGTMHYQSGEFQLSLKCYKQVLKMRRLLLGNEHPSVADALMNIAIAHEKAGELDRAESALHATIRVVGYVYDKDDYKVGFVLNCLGALHARNGSVAEALRCFTRALDIYKKCELDETHPLVISTKKSIEYVKNGGEKDDNEEGEEMYDFMGSFLTCGGACFDNKTEMRLEPVLV